MYEYSLAITEGGTSQPVAIGTASAASTTLPMGTAVVICTVDCFCRRGPAPVATSDGTDQFIPANQMVRVAGIRSGDKLAFKTATGTGSAYITPGG